MFGFHMGIIITNLMTISILGIFVADLVFLEKNS